MFFFFHIDKKKYLLITNANSWSFSEWHVSTRFNEMFSACAESIWIKSSWIWMVVWIVVQTWQNRVDYGTFFDNDISTRYLNVK